MNDCSKSKKLRKRLLTRIKRVCLACKKQIPKRKESKFAEKSTIWIKSLILIKPNNFDEPKLKEKSYINFEKEKIACCFN